MSVRIGTLSVSMLSICTAAPQAAASRRSRVIPIGAVHVHHQAANLPRSRRGMLALGCSLMLLVAAGGCQSRSTPEPPVTEAEPDPETHSPEIHSPETHSANPAADGESPVGPVKLTESQRAVLNCRTGWWQL